MPSVQQTHIPHREGPSTASKCVRVNVCVRPQEVEEEEEEEEEEKTGREGETDGRTRAGFPLRKTNAGALSADCLLPAL